MRLFLLVVIMMSGCAFSPNYTPETKAGAECKTECATNMQRCKGSSYTCDKSYARCIESCMDIDRLSR